MNVLWAVNVIPADVARKLGSVAPFFGGWVESMARELKKYANLHLFIACKVEDGNEFDETIDGVRYFSLTYNSTTSLKTLVKSCENVILKAKPDLIHIEGTEFLHAKAMLNAGKAKGIPTVVSLQGILNGYYNYQCGQLQMDEMMFGGSLANLVSAWTLHFRKTKWFRKRLKPERDIISGTDYLLGRTFWDRAHSYAINPDAKYFVCNRNLRTPFYTKNWDIDFAERHSIYVGNGYSALKGVHFVIQALPQLIKEYPDVKLYVAGNQPYLEHDKRPFYKRGYSLYLKKLVADLGVADHVIFTGPLDAEQVADRLEHVHCYVLCSTIENSPNTLGEAMLVGTPSVAAYVGGVADMAVDGKEALFYRNDDPALLAWNIKRIFDDDALALTLSENGKKRAHVTHDPEKNAEQLVKVYKEILEDAGK